MVVLPVPGPPVKINKLLVNAAIIASRWTSSYGNGFSSSTSVRYCTTSLRAYSPALRCVRRTNFCAISRSASNKAFTYKFCPSAITTPSEVRVNSARLIKATSTRAFCARSKICCVACNNASTCMYVSPDSNVAWLIAAITPA